MWFLRTSSLSPLSTAQLQHSSDSSRETLKLLKSIHRHLQSHLPSLTQIPIAFSIAGSDWTSSQESLWLHRSYALIRQHLARRQSPQSFWTRLESLGNRFIKLGSFSSLLTRTVSTLRDLHDFWHISHPHSSPQHSSYRIFFKHSNHCPPSFHALIQCNPYHEFFNDSFKSLTPPNHVSFTPDQHLFYLYHELGHLHLRQTHGMSWSDLPFSSLDASLLQSRHLHSVLFESLEHLLPQWYHEAYSDLFSVIFRTSHLHPNTPIKPSHLQASLLHVHQTRLEEQSFRPSSKYAIRHPNSLIHDTRPALHAFYSQLDSDQSYPLTELLSQAHQSIQQCLPAMFQYARILLQSHLQIPLTRSDLDWSSSDLDLLRPLGPDAQALDSLLQSQRMAPSPSLPNTPILDASPSFTPSRTLRS